MSRFLQGLVIGLWFLLLVLAVVAACTVLGCIIILAAEWSWYLIQGLQP